jgi:hypothetical protein
MTAIAPPPDDPVLHDDELALLDDTAIPAPDDFADRVLAARRVAQVRRLRLRWAAGGAACALLVFALVLRGLGAGLPAGSGPGPGSAAPFAGAVVATTRTTTAIGARAIAVVEPGAVLTWLSVDTLTSVAQPRGDVFYRVDRARPAPPFVVRTPAGEVSVEGTCFRIVVTEAAPGREAALQVTVYEGHVAVSGPSGARRLAAGERLFTRATTAPAASPVVELEAEAARLSDASPSAPHGPEPVETVQIDRAELIAMAAECRIAWDILPLERRRELISPAQARMLGIAEPDRVRLEQRLAALQQRALDEMRRLYTEVTGDAAEQLSSEALQAEIDHKSPERELQEALRRISAERAGLAAPPADRAGLPPAERMYRLLVAQGDDIEREVAAVLGAQRARSLRVLEGGWGSRHSKSHGCPR